MFNRGAAHSVIFGDLADVRGFKALLAKFVRRGAIRVYSFCFMSTHFHLYLESVDGRLSDVMQRIESEHTRRSNRRHKRDGALFKGRFGSKPVTEQYYEGALIRYIDFNPVAAGLVARPEHYVHGSATHFAHERFPPWLSTDWLEPYLGSAIREGTAFGEAYRRAFTAATGDERFLIERWMQGPSAADALAELIRGGESKVRAWIERNCVDAGGVRRAGPIAGPAGVVRCLREARLEDPGLSIAIAGHRVDAWALLESGLLRDLCAMSLAETASRRRRAIAQVHREVAAHRKALRNAEYARRFAELATRAITALRLR